MSPSIGQVPDDAYEAGTEVTATVLFVDMRAFTVLSKTQFPYDLVALLNRFLSEIQQSIDAHGGQATMYLSDGLMAVFGLNGGSRHGSRSALRAARDMLRSIEAMNAEFQAALAMPLRIGIGTNLAEFNHVSSISESVTQNVDNVMVVVDEPLFADGFESGDLTAWGQDPSLAGDDCGATAPWTSDGTQFGNLANFTASGVNDSCSPNNLIDAWYEYVAPCTGVAEVTTCHPGL